jgi:hypothetical protein
MNDRKTVHKILNDFMDEYVTIRNFCRKTGIRESTAYSWRQGSRSPGNKMCKRIEEISEGRIKATDLVTIPD